jgi:hypothetical protein
MIARIDKNRQPAAQKKHRFISVRIGFYRQRLIQSLLFPGFNKTAVFEETRSDPETGAGAGDKRIVSAG